jgi:hypothetical protein
VVAGGETSGACVQALGVRSLRIGAPDRPRRALVPGPVGGAGRAAAPGAEVGQLRQARTFFTKRWVLRHERRPDEAEAARRSARRPSLFERGYVHATAGNISVRLADGYLITPTDACLGRCRPDRGWRGGRRGTAARRRPRQQDHGAAPAHLRGRAGTGAPLRDPHPQHAPGGADAAATRRGRGRPRLLPPITPYFVMKVGRVPLIPYHRPGDPAGGRRWPRPSPQRGALATPIRAVMLDRLGPNVWHDTPAAAMATLEELEETARLWLLATPRPHR